MPNLAHGRFPEVGQKQKTERKRRREKEEERLNDGNNNGQATHGARKHTWPSVDPHRGISRFSSFFGQRSVTATWATHSPWSIWYSDQTYSALISVNTITINLPKITIVVRLGSTPSIPRCINFFKCFYVGVPHLFVAFSVWLDIWPRVTLLFRCSRFLGLYGKRWNMLGWCLFVHINYMYIRHYGPQQAQIKSAHLCTTPKLKASWNM